MVHTQGDTPDDSTDGTLVFVLVRSPDRGQSLMSMITTSTLQMKMILQQGRGSKMERSGCK